MDKIKHCDLANQDYFGRFVPTVRTVTFTAPTAELTNFPVLVKADETFNIAENHGYDVHFQDMSGNELAFDLDYYDNETGNGAWWVKIPTLSSTESTSINMLYGDSSIRSNQSSPLTIWSDYAVVYHLNELNSSSQLNSATGLRSSAGLSTPSFQSYSKGTGRTLRFIYSGTGEDRTQGITTPVSLTSNNYSVTFIANNRALPDSNYYLYAFAPNSEVGLGNHNCCTIHSFSSSAISLYSGIYPHNVSTNTSTTDSDLYLFGVSLQIDSFRKGQINQTIQNGNSGELNPWTGYSEFISLINGWDGTYTFDVDELRMCKIPHSQEWMEYEYANYMDHSENTSYSAERLGV